MSFYLNRTGSAEGPLAEQQIVAMIQRGEVTQANICAVGQNQWQPIASHPAFAAALAQRGGGGAYGAAPQQQAYGAPPQQQQPQQGYGAPPQQQPQQAYGAAPTAPGYGPAPAPGPTAPGYGPPQGQPGAYGAAPAPGGYGATPYAPAQGAQAAPKKGKGGLIAIIGILAVLVIGGGAAAAYFMFLGGRGPEIAAALPRDTELYFEIPNIKRLALDVHGLKFVDEKNADEKKLIDDTTQAMSEAFDLSKEDARDLMFSVSSMGMGARKLDKESEGAFLVGFDDTDAVEKLLASKRFSTAGTFGEAGKKYQLDEKKVEGTPPKDPTKAALFAMELKGTRSVLVWFPKKKLVVAGSEALVADIGKVLEQDAASLKKNETFEKGSKDFASDARAVALFDPSIVLSNASASDKEIFDGFFKSAGPITGSVSMKDAGAVFDVTARFSGNKYPKAGAGKPLKLDAAKRLPAETFAYMAFTPKPNMTGADVEKQLLENLTALDKDNAVRTEQQLREMERAMGVTFTKLVDSIGEQSVIGFAAPDTFTVDPTKGDKQMMDMAAFAVIKLGDETPLKTVLGKLKEQFGPMIEREAVLKEEGGGYIITSKNPEQLPISVQAKFIDKQLVLGFGNTGLVDKGVKAIASGTGTLESNGAHKAALASLPAESHLMMWIDAGRIGDTLQRSPLLKKQIDESGFDVSKLKFTGDQRITTAISVDAKSEGDVWTFRLHALNAPALATVGGAMAMISAAQVSAALAAPPPDLSNTAFNPQALGTTIPTVTPPVPTTTDTAALVAPTPPTTAAVFKTGDKVDVEWHGKFYPSTVLAVLPEDKYKIHYDGWSSSWDEVVPVKRIKSK